MKNKLALRRRETSPTGCVEVTIRPPLLNPAISKYYDHQTKHSSSTFESISEIPTTEELTTPTPPSLESNLQQGPWASKNTYLQSHYSFLREEATRDLREAISNLKYMPTGNEETFNNAIGIYEKVRIHGIRTSTRGISTQITFSTRRTGKKIQWEQSKRLLTGMLVALSPSNDGFSQKVVIAIVASHVVELLNDNPPQIELFFARASELEIDPSIEWTMIEAKSSFFEAQRHTMTALQKMVTEAFPLSEHFVSVDRDITVPAYLSHNPECDMSTIYPEFKQQINIITDWPTKQKSALDESQQAALCRILTKRLAMIQGPPGTGKTYVSVEAIRALLANSEVDDPPIIVTAQTNHALDQLLLHIAKFEPRFIRIGGRTKDTDVVAKRTLFKVRKELDIDAPMTTVRRAKTLMEQLEKAIVKLLEPLCQVDTVLSHQVLKQHGLITEKQADSLEDGVRDWVQTRLQHTPQANSPIWMWAKESLIKVPHKQAFEDFGFDFEEEDLEVEELQDIEAENALKSANEREDEFIDCPAGNIYALRDNFTCTKGTQVDKKTVERLLAKEQDFWKIPEGMRGAVYRHLQNQLKALLLQQYRDLADEFNKAARQRQIGYWERDELTLRAQKVIGLTTTGLSKYRGLISALKPRIILVEEAAETLESPLIAACLPSLQHLILVGDHKQLRPHCQVQEHERQDWNISLFERLISNGLGVTTLASQRRMIPEIRRLLRPIYGNHLIDHDSVKDKRHRPDVPGMGGINSYFFMHQWPERRDESMSCINQEEADMIIGLVEHLVFNGMSSKDITILTFYNGQRKKLLQCLRKSAAAPFSGPVVTVDSYQGEENKVVILSLVRSNSAKSIGFLANDNRLCVAMSRAQCGFYMFGDAQLLNNFKTWQKVIRILCGRDRKHPTEVPVLEPQRFHELLPIVCSKHNNRVEVRVPSDWDGLCGGCRLECRERLACGHECKLLCHPYSHDLVGCHEPCERTLACGHKCSVNCSGTCVCRTCTKAASKTQKLETANGGAKSISTNSSSTDSWNRFAKEEHQRFVEAATSSVKRDPSPLKEELLIEFDP